MLEEFKVKGMLSWEVRGANGRVRARGKRENTVTGFYKTQLRNAVLNGGFGNAGEHAGAIAFCNTSGMSVNDSSGQVGATGIFAVITVSPQPSPSGIGTRLVATFTAGGGGTGTFTGTVYSVYYCGNCVTSSTPSAAGQTVTSDLVQDIYAYANNFGVTLNAGDSVTVTWDLTIS